MFKVEQKVVCIKTTKPLHTDDIPIINGKIYTVDEVYTISIFHCIRTIEAGCWESCLFRPLDETFATEILEQIKEQIEQEELVLI